MIDMSKIADMLGVRLNEPFAIGESDEEYILDEKGVRTVGNNTPYMPMTLGLLLQGALKIKRKPFIFSVRKRCDSSQGRSNEKVSGIK